MSINSVEPINSNCVANSNCVIFLFYYKINITCIEVDFPIAAFDTFPIILLSHTIPPVLELSSSLAEIFHQFLI